jgi:hypothetical protein
VLNDAMELLRCETEELSSFQETFFHLKTFSFRR